MLDWRLCFVTDRRLCPGQALAPVVEAACAAGLRAVQLREKDLTTRQLYNEASTLRMTTRRYESQLIVNGRLDIALAVGADTIHAPEADTGALASLSRDFFSGQLGVSCHSLLAAAEAERNGVDYVTFGPVFDTPAKQRFGAPQGLDKLERVTNAVDIPVVAIGGVTPMLASECLAAGAAAVAVIAAIATAEDIPACIGAFGDALGGL